jgi:hypothetical protein
LLKESAVGLKPQSKQTPYRSGEPLRHPKTVFSTIFEARAFSKPMQTAPLPGLGALLYSGSLPFIIERFVRAF